jgi:hypothetical protein
MEWKDGRDGLLIILFGEKKKEWGEPKKKRSTKGSILVHTYYKDFMECCVLRGDFT